jgi:hypothetical protein
MPRDIADILEDAVEKDDGVTAGKITMETALAAATRPHDFKLLVQGEGPVATTMEDVVQHEEQEPTPAAPVGDAGRDPANLIPGL